MENRIIAILSREQPSAAVGYAVTSVLLLTVLLFELAFRATLHRYMPFMPVIFFAAIAYGRNAGFFATLLSAVLADGHTILFVRNVAPGWEDALFLFLYIAVGCAIAMLIDALRRAVRKLCQAEAETSLLLAELAHRTRNDLMMIASVLAFQARRQSEPQVRAALDSAVARVRVIAEAQERLRKTGKHGQVEVASYLQALGHGLGELLRDVRPITVSVHATPMSVEASAAVSIGLIANELVTNAFKYAFPEGQGGTVQIILEATDGGMALTVEDDGVGYPPSQPEGLGSRLVQLLASHLGGHLEHQPTARGHRVRVTLPIKPARAMSAVVITGTGLRPQV